MGSQTSSLRSSSEVVAASSASPFATPSSSPWIRKPISVVHQQESEQEEQHYENTNEQQHYQTASTSTTTRTPVSLRRHLSVTDLIFIGVGGTVGSGIFALTGEIAHSEAGPATALSFAISGLAAACSAVAYAELAAHLPAAGSTYVYAYVCLGELAAVTAAACLTLEYGLAGAAVARTWGDKVILWCQESLSWTTASAWLYPGNVINLPSVLVSAMSTWLLLIGVSESKSVTNFFTSLKMLLLVFMMMAGFWLWRPRQNMRPFVLESRGWSGVLRGATKSFFGYLGYDEVCCVAGEAKDPVRDMPTAVLGTIAIVTVCYILASLALTGMVPSNEISATSAFPQAFATRQVEWASQLTGVGEVITLPVVVLVSLMAQPRLTYSMAQDGLLPQRWFGRIDPSNGVIRQGTLISGILMTVVAGVVPFTYLDDLISAGILVALSMTNCCLILLRTSSVMDVVGMDSTTASTTDADASVTRGVQSHSTSRSISTPMRMQTPDGHHQQAHQYNHQIPTLLAWYNATCLIMAVLWSHETDISTWLPGTRLWAALISIVTLYILYQIIQQYHVSVQQLSIQRHLKQQHDRQQEQGSSHQHGHYQHDRYQAPFVPYLPCLGMFINWYLIAQLEVHGLAGLCLYIGLTVLIYLYGCAPNSIGHLRHWRHQSHANGGGDGVVLSPLMNANSSNNNIVEEDDSDSHPRPLRRSSFS